MDVKSLYTNISNYEGIEAVKEKVNAQNDKRRAAKAVIRFLFQRLTFDLNLGKLSRGSF